MTINGSDNSHQHQQSDDAVPGIVGRASRLIPRISLFGEDLGCRETDLLKGLHQNPRTSPQSPFADRTTASLPWQAL